MVLNCGVGEDSTHGHHQMVNIKIRLIIFFTDKDGEALYSQQKQDWELTVAQIMNSLLPNSHNFMTNRWGNNGNSDRLYILGLQNHCRL